MTTTPSATDLDLIIARTIDAPRALVWAAWANADLLKTWWAPAPFTVPACDLDFRPGGILRTLMRAPDGTEFPTQGVFLELVEHERIVFTDALDAGWRPAQSPFFTAVITLDDQGDKTKYTVRALHKTAVDRQKHEQMGFHSGWGTCLDQLAAVASHLERRTRQKSGERKVAPRRTRRASAGQDLP